MLKRLVLRWVFGARPAAPAPAPIVHRGERELCPGPGLGAPAGPVPKLSYDEALRCFGVHQGR
ncbi:hypothetical protein [Methylobacterium sp. 22177]|uniref:hypothetical protein n=1 Tax=Methylobacterium sp. 22177 TaxID=3453885 RepID=UPI003F83ECD1